MNSNQRSVARKRTQMFIIAVASLLVTISFIIYNLHSLFEPMVRLEISLLMIGNIIFIISAWRCQVQYRKIQDHANS